MIRKPWFNLAVHFALVVCVAMGGSAYGQLRVVTYNTLDKPGSPTDDMLFQTIMQAIGDTSANGIAKRVDILAVQEQTTSTATRMAQQLNTLYGVTSYTAATVGFGSFDRVGMVYDTSSVEFLSGSSVDTGGPRPAYRVGFRPVGYTSADATLYVYSAHLKASDGASDYETRDAETTALNANAGALGVAANFIIAGDLNLYNKNDQAYTNLTGPSALGNDPLNLPSWPHSGVAQHLTQSTRTASLPDGGSTGGMDDRFDHQVISDSLLDGEGISYLGPTSTGLESLTHSYKAFGNDGVSYNQSINNIYAGRSQSMAVIDALYNFSDHLPVVADYQLPAKMMAELANVPSMSVGQNSIVDIDVLIENIANVVAAAGADELDYTIGVSGALSLIDAGGTAFALAGSQTKQVRLDTSTLGPQMGMVTVTTASQGAANPVFNLPVSFTVGPGGGGPVFGVIARDDFDAPLNLNSFVQSPLPNAFSSPADGFQRYQVGVSSTIPFNLVDDSNTSFPADALGVIDSATKSDGWFGVSDLTNPNNPSGNGSATWQFNIAGATGLKVSIDMAAMGVFETEDVFNWTYSIDEGSSMPLFTSSTAIGVNASYTMADGDVVMLANPIQMTDAENDTVQLTNVLQTLASSLAGTGTTLTIALSTTQDGEEAYAFDNIVVEGFTGGDFLEGDFNEDTFVNDADLAQWEDDYGMNGDSDADGDGDTDGLDFLVWQRQYGQSSGLAATHAVPEPTAACLALLSLCLTGRRWPR